MNIVASISIGAAHSCAAVVKNGAISLVPFANGETLMHTCVRLKGATVNINEFDYSSRERFIKGTNLILGKDVNSEDVMNIGKCFPFEIVDHDGEIAIKTVKNNEECYTPVGTIHKALLQYITKAIQSSGKYSISKTVLTIPISYSPSQCDLVKRYAEEVGLPNISLFAEPVATVVGHLSNRNASRTVFVFSLGSESLECCVVKKEGARLTIEARGRRSSGGDCFDVVLARHIVERARRAYGRSKEPEEPKWETLPRRRQLQLIQEARLLKERLSLVDTVYVNDDVLSLVDEEAEAMTITREEYDGVIGDDVKAILQVARATASRGSAIEEVILLGKSTQVPAIREQLMKQFPTCVFSTYFNETIVAKGGCMLSSESYEVVDNTRSEVGIPPRIRRVREDVHVGEAILDVCEKSIGMAINGDKTFVLYPKHAKCNATYVYSIFAVEDDQERMHIQLCQGEDPCFYKNKPIGDFYVELTGKSVIAMKYEMILDVCYSYAHELTITVHDKQTNITTTKQFGKKDEEKDDSAKALYMRYISKLQHYIDIQKQRYKCILLVAEIKNKKLNGVPYSELCAIMEERMPDLK